MENRTNDHFEELPSVETPDDVAVLYSWANLHGAKYRDFSASRREYRAQLRHRAAEQVREVELRAQADAEAAADIAEHHVLEAERTMFDEGQAHTEREHLRSLREAEEAAHLAAAERIEAARCAEAAAQAEAAARREEREIAEAHASARRQAAIYAEADVRHRRQAQMVDDEFDVPGQMSDPYTPGARAPQEDVDDAMPEGVPPPIAIYPHRSRLERPAGPAMVQATPYQPAEREALPQRAAYTNPTPAPAPAPMRRPQGYRPDDASGVRQIYRPASDSTEIPAARPMRKSNAPATESPSTPRYATRETTLNHLQASSDDATHQASPRTWMAAQTTPPATGGIGTREMLAAPAGTGKQPLTDRRTKSPAAAMNQPAPTLPKRVPPVSPQETNDPRQLEDPTPKRRRQDLATYRPTESDRAIAAYRREQAQPVAYANARPAPELRQSNGPAMSAARPARIAEPVGPAWIYAEESGSSVSRSSLSAPRDVPNDPSLPAPDTLQRSREKVASRWYALKGVFEQGGQERQEVPPVRQKETRTPVLAVFSLAGGVGKTSLVATLGRSLSSLGEKVLLTDTTSHGLLPFYFGASELREGTVRTFSPPSGSTDAPIYLVSYGVDQMSGDDAAQEALVDEIASGGRGTHRIVLDLTASTGWVVRRMAGLSPTILVPVAPDMNSVISLQALEKFFSGVNGADGAPLKFFYVLNQFDASLPLHLDVREVLRRQLGERLLPFVIRRAPVVSEALAEGMTVVDYAPDAGVAEDYMNVATWLRAQSAPATAGFRNVRWSER